MDENNEDVFGEEEEEEENVLDPSNPEHAYIITERNFAKIINEIECNPEASQYTDELTKVLEYLVQSKQQKDDLAEQFKEANNDLDDKKAKIDAAIKLAEADKATINELKQQIEHAWKLADAAHLREQLAQETIDNLRKQIEALNAEIDFRNKMGQQDNEESAQMSKQQEGLQRERDRLVGEVAQLSQKLTNALGYQDELERKNSEADLRINEISGQLEDNRNEIDKYKRMRDKLEDDIADMHTKFEKQESHITNLNNTISSNVKQIARMETQTKDLNNTRENLIKDLENMTLKHKNLQEEHNASQKYLSEIKKKFAKKAAEQKNAEDAASHLRSDLTKLTKAKDVSDKKLYLLETEKNDLNIDRVKLRQRIALLEKEIEDFKRQGDADKRLVENAEREKDILNKSLVKQEAIGREQQKLIKIQERGKKKLELELDNLYMENNRHLKTISGLEKEKDRLTDDQLNLNKDINDLNDEVKLKKTDIAELTKSLNEFKTKLRMQQNLFDAVRTERNALQKSLQEANAESGELKKMLKLGNHQIEQLKEDIATKERQLVKEENLFRKLMKEKENLKMEINNVNENIRSLKKDIGEMETTEKRLRRTIQENEKLIREQKNDLEQLMNERDILGSQLVRRNDEIALLHEKISILQTTLQSGESQYDQRLQDIRLLKLEIRRLRQENNLIKKNSSNNVDLKLEVFNLERDLTSSRVKCRALEEELQNPLNIHRWRKLEGSDPGLLDLLQKIQLLQKRLIKQASEANERERKLKETQQLYRNLKKLLAAQPSPEVQGELTKTQKALKLRGDKLKCLVSELNMAEVQVNDYKSDFIRVSEELKQLKKKFFLQKKKLHVLKSTIQEKNPKKKKTTKDCFCQVKQEELVKRDSDSKMKFVGGGFRMSKSFQSFDEIVESEEEQ